MRGGQPMFLILVLLFDNLIMALCMFLIGLYFYGYNLRSEALRKKVNEVFMCQCYGKRMMVMALPFLFGMILDLFKPGIGTGLAWLVWFVLFILLLVKRAKLEK